MTPTKVLAFSTLGAGSSDENRIVALVRTLDHKVFPFDRTAKVRMFFALLRELRATRPEVAVMEGTGISGGLALMAARVLFGTKYVVSSGDAVGPWVGAKYRVLGPPFGLYERVLCRLAAGFIGWTPYLAGRAMTFGCPRAVTAPGWAPFPPEADAAAARAAIRSRLGIPPDAIVVGIAGSLAWSGRRNFCYGLELVAAAARVTRPDAVFLVVGDGSGRSRLEALAANLPSGRVVFTGRVAQSELPGYYAAMDVGSLPQSLDAVGMFRYTTKLSEYLTCGLGVLVGPIPAAYDLDTGWTWRVPGGHPWEPAYHAALAAIVDRLTAAEIAAKSVAAKSAAGFFSLPAQAGRVAAFLTELMASGR